MSKILNYSFAWLAQDSTPETAVDAGEPAIK